MLIAKEKIPIPVYCKTVIIAFQLLAIFLLSACSNPDSIPEARQEFLMGTSINITVYSQNSKVILDKIFTRLKEIETSMSAQMANSDLNKINDAAGKHPVKVKPDLFTVIKASIDTAQAGGGDFDISIGPIVNLWNIGSDNPYHPSDAEIKKLLPLVDFHKIVLNEKDLTVYLPIPGMRLDLGGVAKGYGADEVVRLCKENNVKHALINLGDSAITVFGTKPDGTDWRIGIQRPDQERGSILGVLNCHDAIIQTSGPYERFFMENGIRYHHIMDPRTGKPALSDLDQVTVYSTQNSMEDDTLSTTLFIMGLKSGMEFVKSLKGIEAVFVTTSHKVYVTPGLVDKFTLKDQDFTLIK